MSSYAAFLSRWLRPAAAGIGLFATASCAQLPPTASIAVPPIPRGASRVWFYRDAGPYDAQERPYVRMNGQVVGILEPLGAFYRDVAPGSYRVTVDQYLSGPGQSQVVSLAPGQQAYVTIVSLSDWFGGGENYRGSSFSRPSFYVWTIPPQIAQAAVARTPFYGGS
jgi:hypothetical protein